MKRNWDLNNETKIGSNYNRFKAVSFEVVKS